MENKKEKRKMIAIFAFAFMILISIMGYTYSYFSANVKEENKTETVIKSNELGLIYTGISEITVNDMIPGDSFTKTFSVENTSNVAVSYNIYMESITNEFNEDLVYTLRDEKGEVVSEIRLPETNEEKSYLKTNINIEAKEIQNYTLTITYKYLETPQNENQGSTFSATVGIDTKQINPSTLSEKIISLSLGTDKENGINYNQISNQSNGKGVYETTETDSGAKIYFYRGEVDNNVLFGNFCWKIVRTTETNGVKLIYNGVPTETGICNNMEENTQIEANKFNSQLYQDNAAVGYMYGSGNGASYEETHANINNSSIKDIVDKWYEDNLISYSEYLEDTVWCNDRSTTSDQSNLDPSQYWPGYGSLGYGTNRTFYTSFTRVGNYALNQKPTLKCSQENDKFTVNSANGNGKLDYPIGLITSDEVAFAGGKGNWDGNGENTSFYLYTGSNYWTLSPSVMGTLFGKDYAFVGMVTLNGNIHDSIVNDNIGIRPVISVKQNIIILNGDGSSSKPYELG